jgi:hypothetical protein
MPNYHKLFTASGQRRRVHRSSAPDDLRVANIDRATLINNVTLLAKCAKEFGVPAVLTAVETEGFSGYVCRSYSMFSPGNRSSNARR